MTDKIDVTIRLDKADEDIAKLKRILKDMKEFEVTAKNNEDAIRLVKNELHRRLVEAGLSR